MLKAERVSVMNLENAMRGARNPLNSWARSDSAYDETGAYVLGENDLSLALRLCAAGSDHRKFIRQIFVSMDITAPLYWWKEFDTYKVGTVANSTSTMHKLHARAIGLDDFSTDHMTPGSLAEFEKYVAYLETVRLRYAADKNKTDWYDLIQLLPSSYNQMRTVSLNYEVLANIYFARRNHKLDEWRELCKWIEELPYSEVITCNVIEGKKAALKTFVDDTDATPVHGGAFDKPTDAEKKEIQELKAAINKLREQKWSEEQITKLLQRAADPANPNGIDHEG